MTERLCPRIGCRRSEFHYDSCKKYLKLEETRKKVSEEEEEGVFIPPVPAKVNYKKGLIRPRRPDNGENRKPAATMEVSSSSGDSGKNPATDVVWFTGKHRRVN